MSASPAQRRTARELRQLDDEHLAAAFSARQEMNPQQRLACDHLRWLSELSAKTGYTNAHEVGAVVALAQGGL